MRNNFLSIFETSSLVSGNNLHLGMKHEYFKLVVVTIFDSPTLQNNSSFLFFLDSPASFLFDKLISFTVFFSRKIEYCYLNIYFMPFSICRLSLKFKKKKKKKEKEKNSMSL